MAVKNQEGEAGTIEIDESVPVTPELVREDVLLAERIKRHVHDALTDGVFRKEKSIA